MKKILFILVLLGSTISAQTIIKTWDASSKVWKIIADTSTSEYTPLPVNIISGSTAGSSLETTQLLVKKLLELNRPSGLSYYSNLAGDFTATPNDATKTVTISGLPFTFDHKDVVYAARKLTAGTWEYLGVEPASVVDGVLTFSMSTNFLSTDQVDIVFVGPTKTQDKTLDIAKTIEQSPLWAKYETSSIEDGTNIATGTTYTISMDGYKNLSLSGKLIDGAGETTSFVVEGTNDEDLVNGDYIVLYGYDPKNNAVVNVMSVTNATLTYAWDFQDLNFSTIRITLTTSASTNTVIIKGRRTY